VITFSNLNLWICFFLIQIFSAIQLKGGLPSPFLNLRTLEVVTGLNKSEIPGILCLFRNAPLLHALKLEIGQCDYYVSIKHI
jgi:hypothetical protein